MLDSEIIWFTPESIIKEDYCCYFSWNVCMKNESGTPDHESKQWIRIYVRETINWHSKKAKTFRTLAVSARSFHLMFSCGAVRTFFSWYGGFLEAPKAVFQNDLKLGDDPIIKWITTCKTDFSPSLTSWSFITRNAWNIPGNLFIGVIIFVLHYKQRRSNKTNYCIHENPALLWLERRMADMIS